MDIYVPAADTRHSTSRHSSAADKDSKQAVTTAVRPSNSAQASPVALFCHGGVWATGNQRAMCVACPSLSQSGALPVANSCLAVASHVLYCQIRTHVQSDVLHCSNCRCIPHCSSLPQRFWCTRQLHSSTCQEACITQRGHHGHDCMLKLAGDAWQYAPLAHSLAKAGILTCVIQYTLYPKALLPQMVQEVDQALSWTFDNIGKHGGDPQRVPS